MSRSSFNLLVTPVEGLLDEPIQVNLSGLEPGADVLVEGRSQSPQGGEWHVAATYVPDADGEVDLDHAVPVSGDYHVADASALIWAQRPPSENSTSRGLPNGENPWEVEIRATQSGASVVQTIRRLAVAPDVTIDTIDDDDLAIHLFLPPGEGPHPTVLVLAGSGGGFPDLQAALLASHGIAAVSLAYFGVEGLPDDLRDIPLEYFERALAWIDRQPQLDSDHLAVSGTSRGGELALLLASQYPAIRSVVAWVPSGYVWGAVSRSEEADTGRNFASWTIQGEPVPYAGRVRNDDVAADDRGVLNLTPAFHTYLEDTARAEQARIPIERINGPVLLISGKADALWPSAWFGDEIEWQARAQGFDFAVEHLSYDNAGHGIGSAIAPTTVLQGRHPVRQVVIGYGGTPEGLAAATRDAWPKVVDFLRRNTGANEISPVASST